MPENPAALHIVGVTGTGRLTHTIRTPDGWTPFVDVLGPAAADRPEFQGYVTEVAAARVVDVQPGSGAPPSPEALVLAVLVSSQPHPLFFLRYADTGRWAFLGSATGVLGARRVALTAVDAYAHGSGDGDHPTARLHLAWTGRGGQLSVCSLHVPVTDPSTPDDGGTPIAVEGGTGLDLEAFRVPALAGSDLSATSTTRLRLAGVTADGRMSRMVVTSTGAAEVLGDVEKDGAGEAGEIVDTSLANYPGGCEHYAAVTGDGRILLATNNPAGGGWSPWRDLEEAEFVLVGPGATVTYRDVAEFGTFARVALAVNAEGLHVLGVTTSGRLLHQVQAGLAARAGDGQQFRDVEQDGVGTDVGQFVAVAAA